MRTSQDPLREIREALQNDLPKIYADSANPPPVAFTFVPPSHARALEPDNILVEGIRGSGKSFWWRVLNSQMHRRFISVAFPRSRIRENQRVTQAVGIGSRNAPDKDTLARLVKTFPPRQIWRGVLAHCLGFSALFPKDASWSDRISWVDNNPEEFSRMLDAHDEELERQNQTHLVLFDALDRLADGWNNIRPLAKAIFQVALETQATQRIRLKLFVRPDMLEDREILAFPDSSKMLARKVSLTWRKTDLYAVFFQCLGNSETGGEGFRALTNSINQQAWEQEDISGIWKLPSSLVSNEENQKRLFHHLTGPAMASGPSGHKRGIPYSWLPNHLMDGREQVSPRSFFSALEKAAQSLHALNSQLPLPPKAIQEGVQNASRIRVDELVREDYPWVSDLMDPLKDLLVPCQQEVILKRWKEQQSIEKLSGLTSQSETSVKLPPQHLDEGSSGVLRDLEELGLIYFLADGRVQIPDVYRIGFGLGRKGGVRPLR